MRKSKFNETQIVGIWKDAESGMPVGRHQLLVIVALTVAVSVLPCRARAQSAVAGREETAQSVPLNEPERPSGDASYPRSYRPSDFNLSVVGGSGLLQTLSPYTLGAGRIAGGGSFLNFDRNPGDVDFWVFGYQIAAGLGRRAEIFFHASPVLRTNSVGQEPVGFPVPPLNLFIDTSPTTASRPGPVFMFAQEVPYKFYDVRSVRIDPPGHGAFAQSSGNILLGGKFNLLSEDRGNRFGFGVRTYAEIPTEEPDHSLASWRDVAGVSGKTNIGLDLLTAKRFRATEVLLNIGYKHVGDPDQGMRIQFVDSSQTDPGAFVVGPPQDVKLDLRDQLGLSVGASFPVFAILRQQVWLLSEFGYTRYIASGVPTERLVHPAEMRLGLQANVPGYKNLALGVAWQLLFNNGGDGDLRTTFLQTADGRGDINFSEIVDPALAAEVGAFFASRGASVSPTGSRVFSTNNAAFDNWRNIPTTPKRVISQGGGNLLGFITWRIR